MLDVLSSEETTALIYLNVHVEKQRLYYPGPGSSLMRSEGRSMLCPMQVMCWNTWDLQSAILGAHKHGSIQSKNC